MIYLTSFIKYIIFCFFILVIFLFLFSSCKESPENTLTIHAGAGLKELFEEAGRIFEKNNPDVNIVFNFAGAPRLLAQLKEGAPGDIFACPDEKQMEIAVKDSLIISGSQRIFAENKLVIIYPKENKYKIKYIYELTCPGLKIDMADSSVPVGSYALKMLDATEKASGFERDFKEKFLKNVISREDNVKSVVNKVILGEVDAGVVYYSDMTEKVLARANFIEVPPEVNQTVYFFIAPLKNSSAGACKEKFINFLLSSNGQEIVEKHGFIKIWSKESDND